MDPESRALGAPRREFGPTADVCGSFIFLRLWRELIPGTLPDGWLPSRRDDSFGDRASVEGGPTCREGGIPGLSSSLFASSPAAAPASFAELSCWVGLNPLEGRSALGTHCWAATEQSEADAGYLVGFLSQGPGSGSAGWSWLT